MSMQRASLTYKTLAAMLHDLVDVPSVFDCRLYGLALDSRDVRKGYLFIALSGSRFKAEDIIPDAIANGALAVIQEADAKDISEQDGVIRIRLPSLRSMLGALVARYFDNPSQKMAVIGVTGTNGKSSVTHYIAQMLQSMQIKAGVIGTVGYGFPDALEVSTHTTPDVLKTHRILSELQENGAQVVAMEVSSHGLQQGRVDGVQFTGAIFTNLSREHLDYHHSMEEYGAAKRKLFRRPELKFLAINCDDEFGRQLHKDLLLESSNVRHVGSYSRKRHGDLWSENTSFSEGGVRCLVHYQSEQAELHVPLLGAFNLENVLAAMQALLQLGYGLSDIVRAASLLKPVSGRMERFGAECNKSVVVDYAHTPDALSAVLKALRPHCQGKLVCLFGCGGDRDRGKRAQMGRIVEQLADSVILSNDNPRTEKPEDIIQDILQGVASPDCITVEMDRKKAVQSAVASIGANDVLLVAGKGHEDYQEIDGRRIPYSDIDVVKQALANEVQNV